MSDITFRTATEADLPVIVAMLADDEIAENRENAAVRRRIPRRLRSDDEGSLQQDAARRSGRQDRGLIAARVHSRRLAQRHQARADRIGAREVFDARARTSAPR